MTAQDRQARLFLGGDDVEHDAGFAAHPFDELFAVGRAAAGLGRDRAGQVDVAPAQLVGADVERAERPLHRFLAQPARFREPFAQAHDAAEGVDHGEVLARRAGDQEPAIVGAEVQRGIGLPPLGRSLAGFAATRRALARCFPLRWRGALVAEVSYLAGRLALVRAWSPVSVRRRKIRHVPNAFFILPRKAARGPGADASAREGWRQARPSGRRGVAGRGVHRRA